MSNLRLSYLQKVGGGMFVQAIPPTQKSASERSERAGGGDVSPHPPGIYASGQRHE